MKVVALAVMLVVLVSVQSSAGMKLKRDGALYMVPDTCRLMPGCPAYSADKDCNRCCRSAGCDRGDCDMFNCKCSGCL